MRRTDCTRPSATLTATLASNIEENSYNSASSPVSTGNRKSGVPGLLMEGLGYQKPGSTRLCCQLFKCFLQAARTGLRLLRFENGFRDFPLVCETELFPS